MASALAGSMSSLTAMQILPQSARSEAAPCRPRQTSVRAVPRANCRKMTLRKFVNGSCIATRLMPRMPSWSRRCDRNIGSKATFFITLDSLGVTWLMMETNTGLRLWVIAVTRIDMLKSSSATWPWLSPNGPSGSSSSLSIRPSMTISASAGTCRSTLDRLGDADGRAGQSAGHRHLVEIDRQLLRAGEQHHRRAADDDGAGHRLFSFLIFAPVQIAAGAARARRHAHAEPVLRFQRGAIGAHVLHAGFGIARDAQRRGEIGRGIEAGRRDRNRQAGEAFARLAARSSPLITTSWQAARGDDDRRDRMRDRVRPGLADVLDRLAHADRVDFRRGGERADRDRNVVAPPGAVDDVGEQKGAALLLGEPALELPAHQRVQLAVFVDGVIDAGDQAARFEPAQMFLEIERRTAGHRLAGLSVTCPLCRASAASRLRCARLHTISGRCNPSPAGYFPFGTLLPSSFADNQLAIKSLSISLRYCTIRSRASRMTAFLQCEGGSRNAFAVRASRACRINATDTFKVLAKSTCSVRLNRPSVACLKFMYALKLTMAARCIYLMRARSPLRANAEWRWVSSATRFADVPVDHRNMFRLAPFGLAGFAANQFGWRIVEKS